MKKLTILIIAYVLFLLLPVVVQAGSCYAPSYSYARSSYCAPSYSSYHSYTCLPPSYSYSYYPASWIGSRYYPAGHYAYSNGYWYRQGYSGIPYYGETYSTAAYEVAPPPVPQVPVIHINIPDVRVNRSGGVSVGEVEVAPPSTTMRSAAPAPAPSSTASASVTVNGSDIQKLTAAIMSLDAKVSAADANTGKLASSVQTLDQRVKAIEKFLSEPPPAPPQEKVKPRSDVAPPPMPKSDK